jgi:hypothetical protein
LSDTDAHIAGSWFDYYGNPDIPGQWVMPDELRDIRYLKANYPGGLEEPEDWIGVERPGEWTLDIVTRPFRPTAIDSGPPPVRSPTAEDILRIARGQVRRQRGDRLHDQIVALIAQRLASHGYRVAEDPQSVDLLAAKDNREALIEVKTVSPRNLPIRMRLGVGQLSEYRYRRQVQSGHRPAGILVISNTAVFPDWLIRYFQADARLGLVSRASADEFIAHTEGRLERLLGRTQSET